MLRYTINIGLQASTRFHEQDQLRDVDILARACAALKPTGYWIRASDAEQTLVIEVEHHPMHRDFKSGEVFSATLIGMLYNLAEDAQQDCIALLIEHFDAGGNVILTQCKLIGPAAHLWSKPDPALILRP